MAIEDEVSLFDSEQPEEVQAVEDVIVADAAPTFEVPEKFQGKSVEEVVESYVNLEKEAGRRANEVGELRKLTDKILQQQVDNPPQQVDDQVNNDNEVGFDDFVNDPASAIDKALNNNPRLKALEANLTTNQAGAAHAKLVAVHKDADEVVGSKQFQDWVQQSASRTRNFQRAHTELDIETASDLIDLYKTTRQVTQDEAKVERKAKAEGDFKKASVVTGGVPASTGKVYRRAELIRLKMEDPQRYKALEPDIMDAYAQGRVK